MRRDPPAVVPAEASYCQALALAEELGMRPLQAHCHRGLGTLYATTGQRKHRARGTGAGLGQHAHASRAGWQHPLEHTGARTGAARPETAWNY